MAKISDAEQRLLDAHREVLDAAAPVADAISEVYRIKADLTAAEAKLDQAVLAVAADADAKLVATAAGLDVKEWRRRVAGAKRRTKDTDPTPIADRADEPAADQAMS